MTIGLCAVTTDGMASAPAVAPAATAPDLRNFRRDTLFSWISVMPFPPVQSAIADCSTLRFLGRHNAHAGILATNLAKLAD
jgi:hypothetical protein